MCSWGVCGMQGWRVEMEDAHIATEISLPQNKKGMLFAVFDGHGGDQVAKFANKKFTEVLVSQAEFKSGNFK